MRLIFTIVFLAAILTSNGALLAQDKYFISFKDKTGTIFSIDQPEAFLSQRAINRRNNQNIEISELDLPVNPNYVQQIVSTGAKVHYSTKWFNGVVVSISHPVQLETIQNYDFVIGAKSVFASNSKGTKLEENEIENDFHKSNSRSDVYNYGQSATQVKMLNGNILHNNGFQGQGMLIAVLDAGFYNVNTLSAFSQLRNNNKILGTKDFVNSQSNIYAEHTHGMLVLSVIGGYLDGQLIGTAPEADFWLIRTEDANTEQIIEEYNWAAGAEFADSVGADVINTSLGYTTFDVESQNHSYANMDGKTTPISIAADIAAKRGMIVVVSAGNEGNGLWQYISAPADAFEIIAAGSVTAEGIRSSFSSLGPSSDGRIKPEIAAMGTGTVVQAPSGTLGTANGTSLSAPVLSGLIACLWQAHPELSATGIRELVLKSSSSYYNPDNYLGYGLPDFSIALNGIIDDKIENEELLIVPNPFANSFTISYPNAVDNTANIKFYNYLGQIAHEVNSEIVGGKIEITLPNSFPNGLYVIVIQINTMTRSAKAIKIALEVQ